MPAKSGAFTRSLQIDLVGPQRHPIDTEHAADGRHDPWIPNQIIEYGIEMMKGFDHSNRLRTRVMFELDGRLGGLDIAVPVDAIVDRGVRD